MHIVGEKCFEIDNEMLATNEQNNGCLEMSQGEIV